MKTKGYKILENTKDVFVPTKISDPYAEICLKRCPYPNKKCNGGVIFTHERVQRLKKHCLTAKIGATRRFLGILNNLHKRKKNEP